MSTYNVAQFKFVAIGPDQMSHHCTVSWANWAPVDMECSTSFDFDARKMVMFMISSSLTARCRLHSSCWGGYELKLPVKRLRWLISGEKNSLTHTNWWKQMAMCDTLECGSCSCCLATSNSRGRWLPCWEETQEPCGEATQGENKATCQQQAKPPAKIHTMELWDPVPQPSQRWHVPIWLLPQLSHNHSAYLLSEFLTYRKGGFINVYGLSHHLGLCDMCQ